MTLRKNSAVGPVKTIGIPCSLSVLGVELSFRPTDRCAGTWTAEKVLQTLILTLPDKNRTNAPWNFTLKSNPTGGKMTSVPQVCCPHRDGRGVRSWPTM